MQSMNTRNDPTSRDAELIRKSAEASAAEAVVLANSAAEARTAQVKSELDARINQVATSVQQVAADVQKIYADITQKNEAVADAAKAAAELQSKRLWPRVKAWWKS